MAAFQFLPLSYLLRWDYSDGMRKLLSVFLLIAAPLYAQTSVPACITGATTDFPAYMTDTQQQLKEAAPALRGIKFASASKDNDAEGMAASTLQKTGAAIDAMVPTIPRLVAEEKVTQVRVPLPFMVGGLDQGGGSGPKTGGRMNGMQSYSSTLHAAKGSALYDALHALLTSSAHPALFSYRVESDKDPVLGDVVEEYRVDAENHPVGFADLSPGNPQGIGFGNAWLLFRSANLPQLRARYLGHQKIEGHQTEVLAFTQIPEKVTAPAELGVEKGSCSFYMQGIVWIDTSTHQIVQLQTDLRSPISDIQLTRLRSEVDFGEVHIEARNLWLPAQVEISWQTQNQAGGELHRYTGYRLFSVTSTIRYSAEPQ